MWGSDTEEQFFTDKVLAAAGIECEIGFSAKHLDRPIDLVIRSSAYGDNQVEVKAAKEKKIGLLSYAEALGELTAEYQSVAVCGSHGKTTISAMLAHVLKQANLSPSAIV
ncbi:MAG: UDP-N-acetylmuramate-L-alanine ligase, partial [Parcubacteria group bacterium GW2011_GWB1_43_66]